MSILLFIIGLVLLLAGAYVLVEGGSSLALRLGISELAVGLTVVAMGTSAPELLVSLLSAFQGATDIAVGNVVGSNIFNILWILGLTATITPIGYNPALNLDIWFLVLVTILFFIFTFTGKVHKVDRREGLLFVVLYAGYLVFVVWRG